MMPIMLGRTLFALVCLIVAAGAVLPLYPGDVATPGNVIAHAVPIAGSVASTCQDCAPGDARPVRCRLVCACDPAQPPAGSHEASLSLSVHLIIGRPSERWWLASKLPSV